jgi:hypothetical protein
MAALRIELAMAGTSAESVPALAALIEIAGELQQDGGAGGEQARPVLDDVLSYLRAARGRLPDENPASPPQEDETVAMLYLEAEACLLRDAEGTPVCDLDNAIECLRRLRALLPEDSDERAEADARLAFAALTRVGRPGGSRADIDEAATLLDGLLARTAPGDPGRRQVTRSLAVARGVRFTTFSGTDEDRKAALGYAQECLAMPAPASAADATADVCHLMIAWLTLARQFTAEQRSAGFRQAEVEAARHDGKAAATLMAQFGKLAIAPDDARVALGHLRQVSGALADEGMRGMKPMLWSTALLAARDEAPDGDARPEDELRQMADELERAAAEDPPGATEMLVARAALLVTHVQDPAGAGQHARAARALNDAAARLPAGHPVRDAGLAMLTSGLKSQVDSADRADDPAAGLSEVLAVLNQVPRDDPDFARLLASVGIHALGLGITHRSVAADGQIAEQLNQAIAVLGPEEPVGVLAEMMSATSAGLRGELRQEPAELDSAIGRLRTVADSRSGSDWLRTFALSGLVMTLIDRHAMRGAIRDLEDAGTCLEQAFASIDPGGPYAEGTALHGSLLFMRAHLRLVWCHYSQEPDPVHIGEAVADLERALPAVGGHQSLESMVSRELQAARALREIASAKGRVFLSPVARESYAEMLAQAQRLNADHPDYPALVAQGASGLMMGALADNNLKQIDRAITLLGDACSVPGLAVRERPRLLALHGFALLTRHFRRNSPRDLSNAIGRLEEARRAVELETGSPYATDVLLKLALAYRTRADVARGDVDRAVDYGLQGLREHTGDVLLQSNDYQALHIARRGREDATEMVRWFLDHGREAASVAAIELGRGAVLHAATAGASVEEALRLAGKAELAARWTQRSPDDRESSADPDLRYEVMLAIENSPAEARLLSPPSVGDIAAALTVSAADVLVYLLAEESGAPGLAVLVDRAKDVRQLRLPGLAADNSTPAGRFIQARRDADALDRAHQDARAATKAWEAALASLCEWAWRVAIGPVLDDLRDRGGSRDWRIVLAPGGELGLIPWHAAREPGTGRYACQRAVLSYASSARQFIDATQCQPQPWRQDPVLISDQKNSERLINVGIRGLHAEHYQAGAVYGAARDKLPASVPGEDTARSGTILTALPGPGGPGRSMLHFGCHGRAEVPVLRSRIRLGDEAGADGRQREILLRVEDIIRQARRWRSDRQAPASTCGLVVLASCLSDVTDADYDEALTLATAFLSAGAGGVVAARWRVDVNATALLMAAFHRYLNAGASPAWALRQAQRWMLDPGRDIPGEWPRELREETGLAAESGGPDLARPAAWAGFTYQGR